jgi:hypothetical protein
MGSWCMRNWILNKLSLRFCLWEIVSAYNLSWYEVLGEVLYCGVIYGRDVMILIDSYGRYWLGLTLDLL